MAGGGSKSSTTTSTSGVSDWAQPHLETAATNAMGLYETGQLGQVAGLNEMQNTAIGGAQTMYDAAMDPAAYAEANKMLDQAAGQIKSSNASFNQAAGGFSDAQNQQGVFNTNAISDSVAALQPLISEQVMIALGDQAAGTANTGNLGGARAQSAAAQAAARTAMGLGMEDTFNQRSSALAGSQGMLGVGQGQISAGNALTNVGATQGNIINSQFNNQMAGLQALSAAGQLQQDQTQAELDADYMATQRLFNMINPSTVGTTQTSTTTQSGGGK